MKGIFLVSVASLSLMAFSAQAAEFSWYKIKERQGLGLSSNTAVSKSKLSPKQKDDQTQQRIMKQYGVYAEKKSVKDRIEQKMESRFSMGVEMNSHPSYSVTTLVNTVDINNNPVTVNQTNSYQSPDLAITFKGIMHMSDLGMPGGLVKSKIAFGSEHIDIDFSKELLEVENLSANAGIGLKVVHKESPAWEKGFEPYVTGGVEYDTDSLNFSVGARYMLSKPSHYDSSVIPYAGMSYKF